MLFHTQVGAANAKSLTAPDTATPAEPALPRGTGDVLVAEARRQNEYTQHLAQRLVFQCLS